DLENSKKDLEASADLPVQGVPAQMRIIFLFLEPVRGVQALFIACTHVTRDGFTLRLRLRAFECDDVAWHVGQSFVSADESSSSPSPSSSVSPNKDVTGWRERESLF